MKNKVQTGHWKYHVKRVLLGAFLPALATYFALDFLLSFRMSSSGSSWLALFIAVAVWNFCNYLMGYIDTTKATSGNTEDNSWLKYENDEPYETIYHYYMIRNHHIKLFNRNDF